MKTILFTLMLFIVALSPLAAACQSLPDEPAPPAPQDIAMADPVDWTQISSSQSAQPPTPNLPSPQTPSPGTPPQHAPEGDWRKIQHLPHGLAIIVSSTLGPALRCGFAGATDSTLFCDAPASPEGTGYRFERATVISVEYKRQERNWHPAWLASMIAAGLFVGLAERDSGPPDAIAAGAVGALVVGAIGAPVAFLTPQPNSTTLGVALRPRPLRFHSRGLMRLR